MKPTSISQFIDHHYRYFNAGVSRAIGKDEEALLSRHMNLVTDTCIPGADVMRRIEAAATLAGYLISCNEPISTSEALLTPFDTAALTSGEGTLGIQDVFDFIFW